MYVTPASLIFRLTSALCSSRPSAETKRSRSVATSSPSSFRRPRARDGREQLRLPGAGADTNGGIAHPPGQGPVAPSLAPIGCAHCTYRTLEAADRMHTSHRETVVAASAREQARLMVAV